MLECRAVDVDRREIAAVFAGGVVGTLARAELAQEWGSAPGTWPWATFAVNLLGAALLGYVATRARALRPAPGAARAFLGPGVCGALTTFSALQLELLGMLDSGRLGLALTYAGASVAGGLLAVRLGALSVSRA